MEDTLSNNCINISECIHSKYILRNDYVLEIHLKKEFNFTIIEAKEITENILTLTNNSPYLALIVLEEYATSDLDVIKYATTNSPIPPFHALAIVTDYLPQVMIVNFIIKREHPIIPTKLFSSITEAEAWLKSIIN